MTKFLSFCVFTFGVLLLLFACFMVLQPLLFPPKGDAKTSRTVAPHSDLPSINIGTRDQFEQQLDQYFESGGLDAVGSHVTQDLVPGRLVISPSTLASEPALEMIVIDREMRLCEIDGSELMGVAPVVSRTRADLKMGADVRLTNWVRPRASKPYFITVWWVPAKG